MANTPEGKVKDQIKKVLKRDGCYFHMPVQNGMGSPTLDFTGCFRCHYFAIEAKAPGKKPTPRQLLTIEQMQKAGAFVFVIDGDTSELEQWMQGVEGMFRAHVAVTDENAAIEEAQVIDDD